MKPLKFQTLVLAIAVASVLPLSAVAQTARPLPGTAEQTDPGIIGATPIEIPRQGSVAATPIEIPGSKPVGATPIEIPGTGMIGATPIEIPGSGPVGATPIEIPGQGRLMIQPCDPNDPDCKDSE